jgi:hypothetical protein
MVQETIGSTSGIRRAALGMRRRLLISMAMPFAARPSTIFFMRAGVPSLSYAAASCSGMYVGLT